MNVQDIVVGGIYRGPAEGLAKRYGATTDRRVEYFFGQDSDQHGRKLSYRQKKYRRDGGTHGAIPIAWFAEWANERIDEADADF